MKLQNHRVPWYLWPLAACGYLAIFIIIGIPLLILAAVAIPYYALFPDHHADIYDVRGTPRQRERLAQWRAAYRRLGIIGRVRRAIRMRGIRRQRTANQTWKERQLVKKNRWLSQNTLPNVRHT